MQPAAVRPFQTSRCGASETRPRATQLDDSALVVLRGVNLNDDADPEDMIAIRIYQDDLPQAEYTRWLARVMRNVKETLAPGAPIYIWNGHRQFGPMTDFLQKQGFHVSCVITWAKESFAMGFSDYHQGTEFCLYGWLPQNGKHSWYGPTNESTLWEVHRDPTTSSTSSTGPDGRAPSSARAKASTTLSS